MPKVLIVTNDFPPRAGGIQSFVHALALRLPAGQVVVYAPPWPGAAEFDQQQPFPVVRHPTSLMLPVPACATGPSGSSAEHGCDTVLFGAAAPLGLLAPALRKAGARRLVAITHGHEAGWAALPVARSLLRRIGEYVDVVTYLGEYFRVRLARALSPAAAARMVRLAPGVDTAAFRPGAGGAAIRQRLGLAGAPCGGLRVPAGPAQGAGHADPGLAAGPRGAGRSAAARPGAALVGGGPDAGRAAATRRAASASRIGRVHRPGAEADLPAYYDAGDVFAMPCRTRRAGLDVEGLGIVYLEASASGLPVIAGDSGGAPDAVLPGETGYVVPGGDPVGAGRPAHPAAGRPGRGPGHG